MKKKNVHLLWAFLNLAGLITTVTINALANILPFNGKQTGELSDSYPNLFVPAGFTFSIWGVIYLLLGVFVVFQIMQVFKKQNDNKFIDQIGPFFILSSAANCIWIFAWHWENVYMALCCMLYLLFSLLMLYFRLDTGKGEKPRNIRFFVELPVSVYLGWITVATIANIAALLVRVGWGRFGLSEVFWTVLVISVAVVVTVLLIFTRNDIGYALVVIWALFGIFTKRRGLDVPPDTGVEAAAATGMIIIAASLIVLLILLKKGKQHAD